MLLMTTSSISGLTNKLAKNIGSASPRRGRSIGLSPRLAARMDISTFSKVRVTWLLPSRVVSSTTGTSIATALAGLGPRDPTYSSASGRVTTEALIVTTACSQAVPPGSADLGLQSARERKQD